MSDAVSNIPSLAELAKQICARWDEAENYDSHAKDARLATGRMLAEARRRVKAGEEHCSWGEWCRRYVPNRSGRDIRQLIKMAGTEDPEAAREAEKARAREGMLATRERQRRNVTPVDPPKEVWDNTLPGAGIADSGEVTLRSAPQAVDPPPEPPATEYKIEDIKAWFARLPAPDQAALMLDLSRIHAAGRKTASPSPAPTPPASPAQIDLEEFTRSELMAAFLTAPADAQQAVRDWVLRGDSLGHNPPEGMQEEFAALWGAADDNERKNLRAELINWRAAA